MRAPASGHSAGTVAAGLDAIPPISRVVDRKRAQAARFEPLRAAHGLARLAAPAYRAGNDLAPARPWSIRRARARRGSNVTQLIGLLQSIHAYRSWNPRDPRRRCF